MNLNNQAAGLEKSFLASLFESAKSLIRKNIPRSGEFYLSTKTEPYDAVYQSLVSGPYEAVENSKGVLCQQ